MAPISKRVILAAHRGGKIVVMAKRRIRTRTDLSTVYTPGVAEVSRLFARDPEQRRTFSIAGDTVAVVSDGSAVLGLGNIGAYGAIPVMEGKAAIFREFAGLNAFPICLATQETDAIIAIVRAIAPVFAAVNLEDIAAPRCFAVESALQNLGIPVMHDDQHGTAVVASAAIRNACRVVGKRLADIHVTISGAGAAGTAIALLLATLVRDVVVVDSKSAISSARSDLTPEKHALRASTNREDRRGALADVLVGSDVFIGVSKAGILTAPLVRRMAERPIVIAMANPTPEIMPDVAHAAGAAVVATGRSDFPNQVNNALAYPGIFRGAIDARATHITPAMRAAASSAIARCVARPTADRIIPSIFDRRVVREVSRAVARAWRAGGATRS